MLVTIFILFYICLVFLYFFFLKLNKKEKEIAKVFNKKLKPYKMKDLLFFCSKNSKIYKIFSLLFDGQVVFEKKKDFLKRSQVLKSSGINFLIPIFKLEEYKNFDERKIICCLRIVEKLWNRGVDFYFFVFVDCDKNFDKVLSVTKNWKYKKSKFFRIYNCMDVDIGLLGAINAFDCNEENKILNSFDMKKVKLSDSLVTRVWYSCKFGIQNSSLQNKTLSENNEIFATCLNDDFKENFSLKGLHDFCLTREIKTDCFYGKLTSTYDFNDKVEIFDLKLKILDRNFNKVEFLVCKKLTIPNRQKMVNVILVKGDKFSFFNINSSSKLNFHGCFSGVTVSKDFVSIFKKINLTRSAIFQMTFLKGEDEESLVAFNKKHCLESIGNLLPAVAKKYEQIKKVFVFTGNQTFDNLINDFLPKRICENLILNPNRVNIDFNNFKNGIFLPNLIDRDFLTDNFNKNFSRFYLIRKDLFKTYFNLLFNFVGVWVNDYGVYFNQNKSKIFDKSVVIFQNGNSKKVINLKNTKLQSQIEIDDVKFSNLNFLSFNNAKNELNVNL